MSITEYRTQLIAAMNNEANNGIWQSFHDKNDFIICLGEAGASISLEEFTGRMIGMVQILKGVGAVSVEPYDSDFGCFLQVKITPRV